MSITRDLAATMAVSNQNANCFKEAVCIDTKRIYDSCSEQHCA